MSYIFNKENYELAKKNNDLDRFRGDEISRRISKQYPISAQIAILMDSEAKPHKKASYLEFRAKIIAEVDADLQTIIDTL